MADPFMAAIGRLGAHRQHALHSLASTTSAGLAAAESRFFLLALDSAPDADVDELLRRAKHFREAHFARLSLAGVRARQERRRRAEAANAT